jgi:branched-chain amino acid transport system ATP-binding protein
VTGVSSDRRFRMGLARTFQGLRLYAGLNCYENLLAGVLGGRDFRALHRRAAELMEVFELKPHRSALPASMPFGKQKLLAIGRALMGDPRLVLLDEPFSGLSDPEVAALSEVFKGFAGRRTALGIVEHNLEALAKLADEVTVLDHGVVIASGAPEEVLERPRVHDAYFGGHRKAGVMRLLRQGTE